MSLHHQIKNQVLPWIEHIFEAVSCAFGAGEVGDRCESFFEGLGGVSEGVVDFSGADEGGGDDVEIGEYFGEVGGGVYPVCGDTEVRW